MFDEDASLPPHSPAYGQYFTGLKNEVYRLYEIAEKARAKGFDPSTRVEIPPAQDVAARVEATLDGPVGVAKRIRELQEKMTREEVAFTVAREIAEGSLGTFDSQEKAADKAVRVALAIATESITAAPLEGIAKVRIRGSGDNRYLALYLAGPIRAAGGTEAALTVLVADYVRQVLGIPPLISTKEEVERALEEVELYARRAHLQYPVYPELVRFAARRLPIMLTGEPTEEYEVSGTRNLERIETNRVRSGAVLVLNDGIVGRAAKLSKIVERLHIPGWEWLKELTAMVSKAKASSETASADKALLPKTDYLTDIIGGRPVFAHPSSVNGFRLRYGRSRNTGLSGVGVHPATMFLVDQFLATGTHIRTERPGKGAVVAPVDSIEGPIVLLKNGTVKQIFDLQEAERLAGQVERILFLGDILVAFGEFLENNHQLVPPGYCEEWWSHDLDMACSHLKPPELHRVLSELNISAESLNALIESPLSTIPTAEQAVGLSRHLGIPLHPRYLYRWMALSLAETIELRSWILTRHRLEYTGDGARVLLPNDVRYKKLLERIGIPHVYDSTHDAILLSDSPAVVFAQLGHDPGKTGTGNTPIELLNSVSEVKIADKIGFTIGARMGRPEKAQERKMRPPVHVLFPVGHNGSTERKLERVVEKQQDVSRLTLFNDDATCEKVSEQDSQSGVHIELVARLCHSCHSYTFESRCPDCGSLTEVHPWCSHENCGLPINENTGMCPYGHDPNLIRKTREFVVDLMGLVNRVARDIDELQSYGLRGVLGLTSELKMPEYIGKGILRAKHSVYCYKDGTSRFDLTDAPLTHFTPKEVGVSVTRLRELGYLTDYLGRPLTAEDQILELKVQDIVVPEKCGEYLMRVGMFVDDCLQKIYGLEKYYNFRSIADVVGQLVIGLAPHTSAGIIGRIIGFTRAHVCYAHPYWHAAKRRNCLSGNEEVLLLDEEEHLVVRTMRSLEGEDLSRFRVISIDNNGNVISQPIKSLVRLRAPEELYRIWTDTGRSITVTADHRMARRVRDTVEYVETGSLQVGDRLLSFVDIPQFTQVESIDILGYYLSSESAPLMRVHGVRSLLQRELKRSSDSKSVLCREHTETIPRILLRYTNKDSMPLVIFKELVSVLDIDKSSFEGYLSYQKSSGRLPMRLMLGRELGELVGLYLSDEHSSITQSHGRRHGYHVRWTTSEKRVAENVVAHCQKIFNTTPSISVNDQGRYVITLSGRVYFDLFNSILGLQNESGSKKADRCISFCTEFQKGLLNGLVQNSAPISDAVSLSSDNRHLLNHIGIIALQLGLYPRFEYVPFKSNSMSTPQPLYNLHLSPSELRSLRNIVSHNTHVRLASDSKVVESEVVSGTRFGLFRETTIEYIEKISDHSEEYVYDFVLEGSNKTFIGGLGLLATYDCDGDEDAVMLVLDALLNFSRSYLPAGRGGFMDAPLVLSVVLNPREVDDESHNMEICDRYPAVFYGLTQQIKSPKAAEKIIDIVASRLNTASQYEGFKFTHNTSSIDLGPTTTRYKLLATMLEKLQAQLSLAQHIAAVDAADVAERVLSHHFIRDIRGNLRAFSTQKMQCLKCRRVYRRVPLSGRCECGGRLSLTVREKNISKYLEIGERMVCEYELNDYLKERLKLIKSAIDSMFVSEQTSLTDFLDES